MLNIMLAPRWRQSASRPLPVSVQRRRLGCQWQQRRAALRVSPHAAPRASRWLHVGAAVHGRRRTRDGYQTVAKPDSADVQRVARLQTALPGVCVRARAARLSLQSSRQA